MPGRLGDDPLSRKRSSKTNDPSSAGSAPVPPPMSHNDVFFRRRTEAAEDGSEQQSPGLGKAIDNGEGPEITEVAELVKTAQAAMSTQGAERLAGPMPIEESNRPAAQEDIEQAPPKIEESVSTAEPPAPTTEEPAGPAPDQSQPEPEKSGGFFKRLFGRIGK